VAGHHTVFMNTSDGTIPQQYVEIRIF